MYSVPLQNAMYYTNYLPTYRVIPLLEPPLHKGQAVFGQLSKRASHNIKTRRCDYSLFMYYPVPLVSLLFSATAHQKQNLPAFFSLPSS